MTRPLAESSLALGLSNPTRSLPHNSLTHQNHPWTRRRYWPHCRPLKRHPRASSSPTFLLSSPPSAATPWLMASKPALRWRSLTRRRWGSLTLCSCPTCFTIRRRWKVWGGFSGEFLERILGFGLLLYWGECLQALVTQCFRVTELEVITRSLHRAKHQTALFAV